METGKAAEKLPTHDPERPWYPRCRWCNGVIHWSWNGGWVHVAEYGSAVIKPCGDGKHEAEPESAATREFIL